MTYGGGILLPTRKRAQEKDKPLELDLEEDTGRKKRDWKRRHERLTNDILALMKDQRYKYAAKELLNIKRAIDAREKALEERERTVETKERSMESQKKRLSKQAAKLAKLKNQLEIKIEELEKRLEALEEDGA